METNGVKNLEAPRETSLLKVHLRPLAIQQSWLNMTQHEFIIWLTGAIAYKYGQVSQKSVMIQCNTTVV